MWEWNVVEREPGWVMWIADTCVICERGRFGSRVGRGNMGRGTDRNWEVGIARVAPNYVLHVAYILLDRRHVGSVVPLTNNAGSRRDYCGGIHKSYN